MASRRSSLQVSPTVLRETWADGFEVVSASYSSHEGSNLHLVSAQRSPGGEWHIGEMHAGRLTAEQLAGVAVTLATFAAEIR